MALQKRLELSHCSLLHNRQDGTFIFYKGEKQIGMALNRTDWPWIFDSHKQLWDVFKIFHKFMRANNDEEVPLGLGDNYNHSIHMIVTFGDFKLGFHLRFKTYFELNGEDKEEQSDVQLTGRDWQEIKEFLYETNNNGRPRRSLQHGVMK